MAFPFNKLESYLVFMLRCLSFVPSFDENWLIGSGKEDKKFKKVKSLQMDRLTLILTDGRTKNNTQLKNLT